MWLGEVALMSTYHGKFGPFHVGSHHLFLSNYHTCTSWPPFFYLHLQLISGNFHFEIPAPQALHSTEMSKTQSVRFSTPSQLVVSLSFLSSGESTLSKLPKVETSRSSLFFLSYPTLGILPICDLFIEPFELNTKPKERFYFSWITVFDQQSKPCHHLMTFGEDSSLLESHHWSGLSSFRRLHLLWLFFLPHPADHLTWPSSSLGTGEMD